MNKNGLTVCLWFDYQAEEAAEFYTTIFKDSHIDNINRYGEEGFEIHGKKAGTVMTVNFSLNGQEFMALNGGDLFPFNESVSFQVFCDTQEEIDNFWGKLTEGGSEGQCGWLKDKFGISWQVIPAVLSELMSDPLRSERVIKTFLQMKKFNIEELKKA
jgi:predicted 3-demethylubiquinone-9 3-methyltransferase (glyoxalase superfamily)